MFLYQEKPLLTCIAVSQQSCLYETYNQIVKGLVPPARRLQLAERDAAIKSCLSKVIEKLDVSVARISTPLGPVVPARSS